MFGCQRGGCGLQTRLRLRKLLFDGLRLAEHGFSHGSHKAPAHARRANDVGLSTETRFRRCLPTAGSALRRLHPSSFGQFAGERLYSRLKEALSAAPSGQGEIAQGKGPTAALGDQTGDFHPTLHGLPCRPDGSARQTMKRGVILIITPFPRAALRWHWATLLSSLRGFGSARCARELANI